MNPHIFPLTKVIPLKLFLDMVVSSSEDVTRTIREQPKRLLETRRDEMPWYMFRFRFIAEMFSALSAVFLFCRTFIFCAR